MKTKRDSGREYVRNLLGRGFCTFTRDQVARETGRKGANLSNTLARLKDAGWIMSVGCAFYAIIDPGNQGFGFAPPHAFLDDWAKHRGLEYYVGGVSAAEMHGASHQRPQGYQVVVNRALRPFVHGDLRITFFRKRRIGGGMWQERTVPSGYLRVSTPEIAAYDLLYFPRACPSLSRVATILAELGEALDSAALASLCEMDCETTPLQRLGWLLDRTGWREHTGGLHEALQARRPAWRLLQPRLPARGRRDSRWHIVENTEVEPDV